VPPRAPLQKYPDTFTLSVSHTTRGPRPGELHGVDYHFVTKEIFLDLKANDGFVERCAATPPFGRGSHLNNPRATPR
jgi:guanylate kinase